MLLLSTTFRVLFWGFFCIFFKICLFEKQSYRMRANDGEGRWRREECSCAGSLPEPSLDNKSDRKAGPEFHAEPPGWRAKHSTSHPRCWLLCGRSLVRGAGSEALRTCAALVWPVSVPGSCFCGIFLRINNCMFAFVVCMTDMNIFFSFVRILMWTFFFN